MSYATLSYYKTTYVGKTAEDAVITAMLNRASIDLDVAALNRIDITVMEASELEMLYQANCAQAEYYIQNGTAEASGSASLGSFSYSSNAKETAPGGLCNRAMRLIALLGFANRAVGSFPVRRMQELSDGSVIPESRNGVVE